METFLKTPNELTEEESSQIVDLFNKMPLNDRQMIWVDGEFKKSYLEAAKSFILAREEDRIIACLFTTTDNDKGTCITVFVDKHYRQQKIGKVLVTLCKFTEKGLLFSKVKDGNVASKRLFESCGFSERNGYYYYEVNYWEE